MKSHSKARAMPIKEKTLLLFDIDGTILRMKDYRSYHIFSALFRRRFSVDLRPDDLPSFSGKTDLQILSETSKLCGIDFELIRNDIDSIWDELLADFELHCHTGNMVLMPGVVQLLAALATDDTYQLALVTGNFAANAYLKLSVFGLGALFPFGAFGSDSADRNDLPGLATLRGNQLYGDEQFRLENSIIIGDSHLDVACARSNGIPCLAVATGNHSAEELSRLGADCVLPSFSDDRAAIDEIRKLRGSLLN